MRYGNAQQKKQWLTPLAQGRCSALFCPDRAAGRLGRLGAQDTRGCRRRLCAQRRQAVITSGKHGDGIVIAMTDKAAGKKA